MEIIGAIMILNWIACVLNMLYFTLISVWYKLGKSFYIWGKVYIYIRNLILIIPITIFFMLWHSYSILCAILWSLWICDIFIIKKLSQTQDFDSFANKEQKNTIQTINNRSLIILLLFVGFITIIFSRLAENQLITELRSHLIWFIILGILGTLHTYLITISMGAWLINIITWSNEHSD